MSTRYETPEEFVRAVMVGAQKHRSNTAELDLTDLGKTLTPMIFDDDHPLNLVVVASRILDGGEVTGQDAMNLAALLDRDQATWAGVNAYPVMAMGMEPLPDMAECLARWGTGL